MGQTNRVEPLELKEQLKDSNEEARIVMPGVQALFGFQLIAVFNDGFSKKLTQGEQVLHLCALGLTAVAMALCMTPSAVHRQGQPDKVSTRLVKISGSFLGAGMLPLAIGVTLDFYIMCRTVLKHETQALALAIILGALFACLWYGLPQAVRGYLNKATEVPEQETDARNKKASCVA